MAQCYDVNHARQILLDDFNTTVTHMPYWYTYKIINTVTNERYFISDKSSLLEVLRTALEIEVDKLNNSYDYAISIESDFDGEYIRIIRALKAEH